MRRTTKTLIRVVGCQGRYEPSLGARVILLVLSCSGSFINFITEGDSTSYLTTGTSEPQRLKSHLSRLMRKGTKRACAYTQRDQWCCSSSSMYHVSEHPFHMGWLIFGQTIMKYIRFNHGFELLNVCCGSRSILMSDAESLQFLVHLHAYF